MSADRYTVTLTGRQVAELLGLLMARQQAYRAMATEEPGFAYWRGRVDTLETIRQAVSQGVATSAFAARARHA